MSEEYLGVYLLAINIISFLVVGVDKGLSKTSMNRVSENRIILIYLAGGWPAGIASQRVFNHKTSKRSFINSARLSIGLNLSILIVVAYLTWGEQLVKSVISF